MELIITETTEEDIDYLFGGEPNFEYLDKNCITSIGKILDECEFILTKNPRKLKRMKLIRYDVVYDAVRRLEEKIKRMYPQRRDQEVLITTIKEVFKI